MASRMKKLFHRKRDDGPEVPAQRTRAPGTANSDPAIRTSLYETTTAGGLPRTGDYPIKGNDSSVMLQAGRKSSVRSLRSRRSSSRDSHRYNTSYQASPHNQYDAAPRTPQMASPPLHNSNDPGSYDTYDLYHNTPSVMSVPDDQRKRLSRSSLPQDFGRLNLGNGQGPTTVTSTVTTTTFSHLAQDPNKSTPQAQTVQNRDFSYGSASRNIEPQSPYANRRIPQNQANVGNNKHLGYPAAQDIQASGPNVNKSALSAQRSTSQGKNAGFGPANLEIKSLNSYTGRENPQAPDYDTQDAYDTPMDNRRDHRQPDMPGSYRGETSNNTKLNEPMTSDGQDGYQDWNRQKSISRKQVGTSAQVPSTPSSSQVSNSRQRNGSKPLPLAPMASSNGHESRGTATTPQPPSILERSRPITKGYAPPQNAHDVINRAKNNTSDTEVIERVAPAVIHENITKDVHNIREEVITREVHKHDVFHRILPIVDIEVLPPRHFLPVEGGGLVEVSAAEVPGRGHSWVIAETASKIPSDQAAPQGRRGFTAREFPGKEGDTVKYVTPDGHEKTEETWVHPPELEEGARLTGQSWPMVFGDDNASEASDANSPANQTNRKSANKGQTSPASPAHRASGFGRMAQTSLA